MFRFINYSWLMDDELTAPVAVSFDRVWAGSVPVDETAGRRIWRPGSPLLGSRLRFSVASSIAASLKVRKVP